MKYIKFLLIFLFAGMLYGGDKPSTNSYVAFDAKLEKSALHHDSLGAILFTLTPVKGIHINTKPAPTFTLDTSAGVRTSGSLAVHTLDTGTYLNPAKPIRQEFRLRGGIKPGALTLKGTLTYYYCSDAEGWCSRFKQPVELRLTVR